MQAVLVTPLPPQPTGLAGYAMRILHLTKGSVDWTVAHPDHAEPLMGHRCIPIAELLKQWPKSLPVVYQLGNSPHCTEVLQCLLEHPGIPVFHEVNLHHLLRHTADITGDWATYREHAEHQYGSGAGEFLTIMNRPAESRREYDMRLRRNPLTGLAAARALRAGVMSDTAMEALGRLINGVPMVRMGFLGDFMEKAQPVRGPSPVLTLGIAGTCHYGRNHEDMYRAVQMFRERRECRLVAAGAGWPHNGQAWLEVTGRLPDMEFRKTISQFDMALDLRHDTCEETSGSMMDLMALGVPAVVTDQGSFRDLPSGSVLRIPADSGAEGAFAALCYLCDNPDVKNSISTAAAEYFLGISNPSRCLSDWNRLLGGGLV